MECADLAALWKSLQNSEPDEANRNYAQVAKEFIVFQRDYQSAARSAHSKISLIQFEIESKHRLNHHGLSRQIGRLERGSQRCGDCRRSKQCRSVNCNC